MAEAINGVQDIFGSTAVGAGSWWRIPQKIGNLTFQVIQSGTVGSTLSSAVDFEGSNDGVNPLATKLGSVSLSSAAHPASDGIAIDANWAFVRAKLNSLTTGSSVIVKANGQIRS